MYTTLKRNRRWALHRPDWPFSPAFTLISCLSTYGANVSPWAGRSEIQYESETSYAAPLAHSTASPKHPYYSALREHERNHGIKRTRIILHENQSQWKISKLKADIFIYNFRTSDTYRKEEKKATGSQSPAHVQGGIYTWLQTELLNSLEWTLFLYFLYGLVTHTRPLQPLWDFPKLELNHGTGLMNLVQSTRIVNPFFLLEFA